ncbi:polymeric immunoglobulin receptor-like [Lepisosteus oculatus]|uniref:polymeric immunoglobulin receptor-like n=1 Tax=Lepisosteus oculatus TaxID=7918 RepID=UPI0035F52BDA
MESERLAPVLLLFLSVGGISEGCSLIRHRQDKISVRPGESALLPCPQTHLETDSCTWSLSNTSGASTAIVRNDGTGLHVRPSYEDRVTILNRGNLSLLISNLTAKDSGTYKCVCGSSPSSVTVKLTVKGCTVTVRSRKIVAHSGGAALLPCACTDAQPATDSFAWNVWGRPLLRRDGAGLRVNSSYEERVAVFYSASPGNLSLLIRNLTVRDQGLYRCRDPWNNEALVKLRVLGCAISASAPAEITGRRGDSVLLGCSCTNAHPEISSFAWTLHRRQARTEILRYDGAGVRISPAYAGRATVSHPSSPGNLSLLLGNLSAEDQGLYQCVVNDGSSWDVTLALQEGSETGLMYSGVGLVALVYLLATVAAVRATRKRHGRTGQGFLLEMKTFQGPIDLSVPTD